MLKKLVRWLNLMNFHRPTNFNRRAITFALLLNVLILPFFTSVNSAYGLVKGWAPPEEKILSEESNGDNPLRIVIKPSSEEEERAESNEPINKIQNSQYPDLGSEQVFPFEPGLGNGA